MPPCHFVAPASCRQEALSSPGASRGCQQDAGATSCGVLTLSGGWSRRSVAQSTGASEIRGREFDLTIEPQAVNFTGADRIATAINGGVPGPTLRWREGEEVTIRVTNRLSEPTSIHWHGILLPWQMDGVPG